MTLYLKRDGASERQQWCSQGTEGSPCFSHPISVQSEPQCGQLVSLGQKAQDPAVENHAAGPRTQQKATRHLFRSDVLNHRQNWHGSPESPGKAGQVHRETCTVLLYRGFMGISEAHVGERKTGNSPETGVGSVQSALGKQGNRLGKSSIT